MDCLIVADIAGQLEAFNRLVSAHGPKRRIVLVGDLVVQIALLKAELEQAKDPHVDQNHGPRIEPHHPEHGDGSGSDHPEPARAR